MITPIFVSVVLLALVTAGLLWARRPKCERPTTTITVASSEGFYVGGEIFIGDQIVRVTAMTPTTLTVEHLAGPRPVVPTHEGGG